MGSKNKNTTTKILTRLQAEQSGSKESKYILLYRTIKYLITNYELPQGWKLPSTRQISQDADLSRTTILNAYELLLIEKLITSQPGSAYRVSYTIDERTSGTKISNEETNFNYPEISERGKSFLENTYILNREHDDNVAFRPGLPPLDIFPINRWKNLVNTYWRHVKSSGLNYSQTTGVGDLKQSICNYLNISRNIKCDPEQIVIVSGSLQSLFLIATTTINKGDEVILENPVFPNVHSVFKSSQAKVIPCNLDDEGIEIHKLKNRLGLKPKLIHVTPSNQYPMGVKMSLKRRKELLQYAEENAALIIENDYENEIANINNPLPTLYSLDKQDRTIYMGTFNRLLHPSIRLGYMIVPKYLKPAVEALQEHSHRFVPPSMQIVMQQFIEKNYLYQHIQQCLEEAKERFQVFEETFQKQIPSMRLQEIEFSSFHRIAFFNEQVTPNQELEIVQKLNNSGVKVLSLSKCFIDEPKETGLILGYSSVRTTIIRQKIETMARVMKDVF